jgi:hypothetical protein
MKINKLDLKRILLFSLPIIIIGLSVVNIETFFSIQLSQITDRNNYHDNILDGEILFENAIDSNFPVIFFTEALFKFIYLIFFRLGVSPEISIKIIISISVFLFFKVLISIRELKFWEILLIFFCPTVIVNYVMTVRQGFALSVFLWIFYNMKKRGFLNIVPLIHFAYFIVLPVYYLSSYLKKKNLINPHVILFGFFILSIFLSIFILKITNSLNLIYFDAFQDNVQFRLGFGVLFWFIILCLFISEGKVFLKNHLFESMVIIFYVGTVAFFNPFSRILQASSVFVLLSGFSLKAWRRQVFIILLIMFDLYLIVPMIYNKSLGSMSVNI